MFEKVFMIINEWNKNYMNLSREFFVNIREQINDVSLIITPISLGSHLQ